MHAKKINQDRNEGIHGDSYEKSLADVRGLIRSGSLSFKEIAERAKLNEKTISNLASGETARPHDRTLEQVLGALGYYRPIVPAGISVAAEVKPEPYWPEDMLSRRQKRRLKTRLSKRKSRRNRK